MSLPFRKGGIVAEAFDNAVRSACHKLDAPSVAAFSKLYDALYGFKNSTGDRWNKRSDRTDLKKHREMVVEILADFDRLVEECRVPIAAALKEFDVNAAEIEAWRTATKAGERFRP